MAWSHQLPETRDLAPGREAPSGLLSQCLNPRAKEGPSTLALSSLPEWPGRLAEGQILTKQPKLFPSHSTEKDVGPGVGLTETCWCQLWAQDSVHRAALVNTLKAEKTPRGP